MDKEIIRILAINPGSTSTKIAIFENEDKVWQTNIEHAAEELARFAEIPDQLPYRRDTVLAAVRAAGYELNGIDVFVGRGGGLDPCEGGTYRVGGLLLEHARTCHAAKHPSTLGAVIANEFQLATGGQAFIVNPPDVDEFEPVARISGIKAAPRSSRCHTLNQKEVGHRAAKTLGSTYEQSNFVIAHIGGGISVAAHKKGRIVDTNDIINGDGPMAPTRSGQVAVNDIINMCFSGEYTQKQMKDLVTKSGGIMDHLGTSDMLEVERRIQAGDDYAKLVYEAMIYQVIKQIGAQAAVLGGAVDAVLLTGGIARAERVVNTIEAQTKFIAPLMVYPGEFEMEALANGALRVLRGIEKEKVYYE